MVTYAVDEHSLHASGHPHADITEELLRRLSLADGSAKQDLLLSQQGIYTVIRESPEYKPWRTATATKLTACLVQDLDGLLSMGLSAQAITERNPILSELYIKEYRIGFRLRMSGNSRYSFHWSATGAMFEPGKMVNESRCLYGDVLRTVEVVMRESQQHVVRFAMSPTISRTDYQVVGGGEKEVVVHNAMVHIGRKGWA